RIRLAVLEHLRTCIRRRESAETAGIKHSYLHILFRFPENARDAEVDDFHFTFICQEYVSRFEVAMDEAALMRVCQGPRDAADDMHCVRIGHAGEIRHA